MSSDKWWIHLIPKIHPFSVIFLNGRLLHKLFSKLNIFFFCTYTVFSKSYSMYVCIYIFFLAGHWVCNGRKKHFEEVQSFPERNDPSNKKQCHCQLTFVLLMPVTSCHPREKKIAKETKCVFPSSIKNATDCFLLVFCTNQCFPLPDSLGAARRKPIDSVAHKMDFVTFRMHIQCRMGTVYLTGKIEVKLIGVINWILHGTIADHMHFCAVELELRLIIERRVIDI